MFHDSYRVLMIAMVARENEARLQLHDKSSVTNAWCIAAFYFQIRHWQRLNGRGGLPVGGSGGLEARLPVSSTPGLRVWMGLQAPVAHGVTPVAVAGAAADGADLELVVAAGREVVDGDVA